MRERGGEESLARRARAGDGTALGELLARYGQPLFAVALARLGNRDDAADVVQETCLRAVTGLQDLERADRFWGWLCHTAQNLAVDRLRARKTREEHAPAVARRARAGEEPGRSERIHHQVVEAIVALPEEYHLPLFCRYVEEASYAEIALAAGRTADSVRGLLYRGTRLLRERLAALMEDEGPGGTPPGPG